MTLTTDLGFVGILGEGLEQQEDDLLILAAVVEVLHLVLRLTPMQRVQLQLHILCNSRTNSLTDEHLNGHD